MIVVIALGTAIGIGFLGLVAGLRKRPRPIRAVLSQMDSDPGSDSPISLLVPVNAFARTGTSGVVDRLGEGMSQLLDAAPSLRSRIQAELSSAGMTFEHLVGECVVAGFAGCLCPLVVWAILSLGGISVGLSIPVWVGLAGGLGGGVVPLYRLRVDARKKRRHARRVIGCFLDLVVLALAGGFGIESALHSAAAISESDVSVQIARALDEARDAGRTPWAALADLGRELGVPEMMELSAAVSLAGTEGARIRSTLAAKAASIRSHELADSETEANTVSERLFLPGVLLLLGFLVFIGYPAVARLTTGF
jgi:tight adherence protein C